MKITLSWGQITLFCIVFKEYLILILFSYTTLAKFNSVSILTLLQLYFTVVAGRIFFLFRFMFNKVKVMLPLPDPNPALKSFAPRCAGSVKTLFHGFLQVHTAHQSFHSKKQCLLSSVTTTRHFCSQDAHPALPLSLNPCGTRDYQVPAPPAAGQDTAALLACTASSHCSGLTVRPSKCAPKMAVKEGN